MFWRNREAKGENRKISEGIKVLRFENYFRFSEFEWATPEAWGLF